MPLLALFAFVAAFPSVSQTFLFLAFESNNVPLVSLTVVSPFILVFALLLPQLAYWNFYAISLQGSYRGDFLVTCFFL